MEPKKEHPRRSDGWGRCEFNLATKIQTDWEAFSRLLCDSHSRRPDCVVLLVCRLVCCLLLKSDNQSVGHSCWPTFLPQLHGVYHQGAVSRQRISSRPNSALARRSPSSASRLPRFRWGRRWVSVRICLLNFPTHGWMASRSSDGHLYLSVKAGRSVHLDGVWKSCFLFGFKSMKTPDKFITFVTAIISRPWPFDLTVESVEALIINS